MSDKQPTEDDVSAAAQEAIARIEKLQASTHQTIEHGQRMLEQLEVRKQASRLPAHSKSADLKRAYVLDAEVLRSIDRQLQDLVKHPRRWTVGFAGDHSVSTVDLEELLALPLLQTRAIQSLSALASDMGSMPIVDFSFRINSTHQTPGRMDVSTRDQALLERIYNMVSETLQTRETWYSWIYRFPVELAVVIGSYAAIFLLAVWLLPTEVALGIGFVAGMASFPLFGFLRSVLFRRVEFSIGFSDRGYQRRRQVRRWVGTFVILGTLAGVAQNLVAGEIADLWRNRGQDG